LPPWKAWPSTKPSKSISTERLFGGALDRLERANLADPLDLGVDHLLVGLFLLATDLEPFLLTELGRRPHPDLELEGQRLAPTSGVETMSMSGSPIGVTPRRAAPLRTLGSASRIASASTAPKPSRWIHQRGGALPFGAGSGVRAPSAVRRGWQRARLLGRHPPPDLTTVIRELFESRLHRR